MNSDEREELSAPNSIWVQVYPSLIPGCLSVNAYTRDPRDIHDSGKPVYEYVRADLLDSQIATKPVGWISCGLRHGHDRIVDIVFENADCAKAFIDGVEPAVGLIVAALAMRDKCVETVRTARRKCEQVSPESENYEYDQCVAWALCGIESELESLTLDQVEEKQ